MVLRSIISHDVLPDLLENILKELVEAVSINGVAITRGPGVNEFRYAVIRTQALLI